MGLFNFNKKPKQISGIAINQEEHESIHQGLQRGTYGLQRGTYTNAGPYYPGSGVMPRLPPPHESLIDKIPSWWSTKRKPKDIFSPFDQLRRKNDFKVIKAKKGMAIAEFRPVTIYKCPVCGREVECGEKVFILAKGGRFNPLDESTVVCHLACAKRLPNIISDLFNAAIADKV